MRIEMGVFPSVQSRKGMGTLRAINAPLWQPLQALPKPSIQFRSESRRDGGMHILLIIKGGSDL